MKWTEQIDKHIDECLEITRDNFVFLISIPLLNYEGISYKCLNLGPRYNGHVNVGR